MKNTPVTSEIFLCELNWTPFLDEGNDSATTNRLHGGFAHARTERHAPASQLPPPRRLNKKSILRQEKFTHKAPHSRGPIGLGAAVGQGTSDGYYEEVEGTSDVR